MSARFTILANEAFDGLRTKHRILDDRTREAVLLAVEEDYVDSGNTRADFGRIWNAIRTAADDVRGTLSSLQTVEVETCGMSDTLAGLVAEEFRQRHDSRHGMRF